jgi:glycosyltransferase involved in cell wall biosynthesis/GT2 family glycosyltransferase
MNLPTISVVVPTYNRREQLRLTLDALAAQAGLEQRPEVIVVSDGSSDGTDEFLASPDVPLPVVALTQRNAGPAAARNHGVRAATGDIVLFVDDDVVPAPDLIAAHLRHHASTAGDDTVVIGPMNMPQDGSALSPWCAWEQDMLDKQYDAMVQGQWCATARQFYTANASLARRHLLAAGGFDESFRRAEDVELAYRLAAGGLRFTFADDAVVFHHAERSFASWLDNARSYGRNDVIFGRDLDQQWLLESIASEFHERHALVRRLVRWCAPRPRLGRVVEGLLQIVARLAALPRVGPVSRLALSGLYNMAYYQGMAEELGSGRRLLATFDHNVTDALRPRVGFILEQTLGHITHSANLQHLVAADRRIDAVFEPVTYEVEGWRAAIPGFGNWTVRAGIRARRAIRRLRKDGALDALFIHTQVPAILVRDQLRRTPTVVSLDATPIQYDELGVHYGHDTGSRLAERLKRRANVACFRRAAAIVAWSEWTKRGLVAGYEVPPEKVVVIPPGVDDARWTGSATGPSEPGCRPLRVLFVGGDLARKGGLDLLAAVRSLREDGVPIELDLVTRDDIPEQDGVRTHHGLTPNSPPLIELYHRADVFCLPTLGDCLPMVLSEAGAVGLPLIATDVGAIGEIVRDGDTGLLVPVHDVAALAAALRRCADDAPLRQRMGENARRLVQSQFDAKANAEQLVGLLLDVADTGRRRT